MRTETTIGGTPWSVMKVLVVGSGGREHALCAKLAEDATVLCAPGNPGIATVAQCFPVKATEIEALVSLAEEHEVDLVVIGPEDPLIAGLADRLRAAGIPTFGPGAAGARLEGSKAYSKQLMIEAGVPTAAAGTFVDSERAKAFVRHLIDSGKQVVVKASGAALGKGVVVCDSLDQADDAIQMMMEDGELGEAGQEVVIEQRLHGFEFSLLTLVSGTNYRSLPVAQDYKRALDGDRGPNTGGMGTYSPVANVSDELVRQTERLIVAPLVNYLATLGIDYRGVLFSGLMVEDGKVYCLEYNVRFGDPETQSVMNRIGGGLTEALLACARGVDIPQIEVRDHAAVTVVLASEGYPGAYTKGGTIELPESTPNVTIYHAGTAEADGQLIVAGGRVLGVTAVGDTISIARSRAYEVVKKISAPTLRWRGDIAAQVSN